MPIFSMVHSMMSPGFMYCGGLKPRPTPAGVPVAIIVPGSRVMPRLSSAMMAGMEVIKRSVLEC